MTAETVPCGTCGQPTIYKATSRCINCWEVEHRLQLYAASLGGRAVLAHLLADDAAVVVPGTGSWPNPVPTENDRGIVVAVARRIREAGPDAVDSALRTHRRQLTAARSKRHTLLVVLDGVDRSIAMRELSIELLTEEES